MTIEKVKKPHGNKGKKRTPEQCAKIATTTKKAMADKDLRKRMKESLKVHYSDPEVRKKMSERGKKYYRDNPDAIQKNSDAVQKYWDENPDKKIEMSKIKKKQYDEHPELKEKLSKIHTERFKNNPELGKHHSEKMKELYEDNDFRERMKNIRKIAMGTPEARQNVSDAMNKFHEEHPEWAEEQSKRITEVHKNNPHLVENNSKFMKKFHKENPEIAKTHSKFIKQFFIDNPHKHPVYIQMQKGYISSLEKIMMEILDSLNIEYIHNHPQIGYFIDFAIIDKKIAIECDGEYWHSLPGAKEHDEERQKILEDEGWNFIRFEEKEINESQDGITKTLNRLLV